MSGRPRVPPAPLAAALGLLLGALVASFGAGLGGRHLAKAGLSLTAVLGFVLLACGLVLMALAVRLLWRAHHRWSLLPLGLATLIVLYAGLLAVTATVVPATALGADTPAAHGLDAREVAVSAGDVQLSAWWSAPRNGAAVVLLHGAGETRTATLPQATVLARRGYGVLLLDARGHGRSGGRGMDLGWYGDADVRAAVDFVAHQGISRVGLLGLSMGGEEALGATAAEPRIRAVVAEGATYRTAEDKAAWLPGGVAGALQRAADTVAFRLVDLLTPASPPTALRVAVRRTHASILLIAAGKEPDEERSARALREAAPDRVMVWRAEGAAHTHALQKAPVEWEQRVVAFLDAQLLP